MRQNSLNVTASIDAKSWSPSAPRAAWARHHDYAVNTSKVNAGMKINVIWENIKAACAKRGYLRLFTLDDGMFQGWTGTCDSILNYHLCLYAIRRSKRKGLLVREEGAVVASLIDDGLVSVELSKDMPLDRQQKVADELYDEITESWKIMGAIVEVVKTI